MNALARCWRQARSYLARRSNPTTCLSFAVPLTCMWMRASLSVPRPDVISHAMVEHPRLSFSHKTRSIAVENFCVTGKSLSHYHMLQWPSKKRERRLQSTCQAPTPKPRPHNYCSIAASTKVIPPVRPAGMNTREFLGCFHRFQDW